MFNFFKRKTKEAKKLPKKKDAVKKPVSKTRTTKKKPKNKNISRKVKIGTTLQTRDNYLNSGKDYKGKLGYAEKEMYRPVVVIDSNSNDELAVHKLTSKPNAKKLPRKSWVEGFSAFTETTDNEGKPIVEGEKFKRNSKEKRLPKRDVNYIKKEALKNASNSLKKSNSKKLRDLKGRK